MITQTHVGPRESWPLRLKIALAVLIAAVATGVVMLAYVLFAPSDGTPTPGNGLSISSDDPLAIADYVPGDAPHILDHWHASYAIFIGDERQPNAPTWEGSGIHTHGDGIIHIHPFTHEEEGSGAGLNKWFEYGGGELTDTTIREPGLSMEKTLHVGDAVPGRDSPGEIYIILNGSVRVPPEYIPQDGDRIAVYFASEEAMRANFPPRTPAPLSEGTATPPFSGTAPPP